MLHQSYRKFFPPAELSAYVISVDIFDYQASANKEFLQLPPGGYPYLLFGFKKQFTTIYANGEEVTLPRNYLCGQTVKHLQSYHYGAGMLSIIFRPEKFHLLLRENMQQFTHQAIDVEAVMGGKALQLSEKIRYAESYEEMVMYTYHFLRQVISKYRKERGSYLLQNAIRLIDLQPERSIDEICRELKVSSRHLRRVFGEQVGIGPKYYLRIKRFHKAAHVAFLAGISDFQDIIQYCGYYDQSHFNRDVKIFSGKNAKDFFVNQKQADTSSKKMIESLDHLYNLEK